MAEPTCCTCPWYGWGTAQAFDPREPVGECHLEPPRVMASDINKYDGRIANGDILYPYVNGRSDWCSHHPARRPPEMPRRYVHYNRDIDSEGA